MASISDQNWVVWNQGKNPLVNFNFMLRVEMLFDLPCKSVRAFSRELEYDYIQEGGLNDYVHMRRKPISKPFTLEVERYVGVDYVDPLPLGADLVLPVLLFVSRAHDQFIPGVVARTYVFTGCTVMKKSYGDLAADQSGLLVETTTIGYREMLCVDIPWSEVGDNMFGETFTTPNQAATSDKSAKDLKTLGQSLYEKAKEAKAQADSAYKAEDAQKLIENLEKALKKLEENVSGTEAFEEALEKARDRLKEADVMDEAEAARDARHEARNEEEKVRRSQSDYEKKEQICEELLEDQAGLKKQQDDAGAALTQLNAELSAATEKQAELKKTLSEELQDPDKASAAVDEARANEEEANAAVRSAQQAYEQALRDLELKQSQDAAKKSGPADEAKQATEQREAAEKAFSDENENNRLATEELEQAEEAYKDAETTDADADADETAASPEEQNVTEKKTALEQAGQAYAAAVAAREAADKNLADSKSLADLGNEIEKLNERIEEAKDVQEKANRDYEKVSADIQAAQKAAKDAKDQLETDKENLAEAEKRAKKAEEKLIEAREAKDKAQKEFDQAMEDLKQAKEDDVRARQSINPIRNNLTNIKARKDKAAESLKNCGSSFGECEKANTTLQSMPDEPLSELDAAYEQVRKHYKDTSSYERQLREMKTYIDQGNELYEDIKDLVEEPASETPDGSEHGGEQGNSESGGNEA